MSGKSDFWKRLRIVDKDNEFNNLSSLCRSIDLDPRTMWNTISTEGYPRLDKAVALAKHFGTTVEYLVTGEEKHELKSSLGYLVDALNSADSMTIKMVERALQIDKKVELQKVIPVKSPIQIKIEDYIKKLLGNDLNMRQKESLFKELAVLSFDCDEETKDKIKEVLPKLLAETTENNKKATVV